MTTTEKITAGIMAAATLLLLKRNVLSTDGVGAPMKWEIAKVVSVERRNVSEAGNPSFWVILENPLGGRWSAYTAPNAGLAYEINNPEFRKDYHIFYYTSGKRGIALQYATRYQGGM